VKGRMFLEERGGEGEGENLTFACAGDKGVYTPSRRKPAFFSHERTFFER